MFFYQKNGFYSVIILFGELVRQASEGINVTEFISTHLNDLGIFTVVVRLALAALLGGIIGLDRDRKSRAAGLRTHMVVSIGAATAVLTNEFMLAANGRDGDPTRMGAQAISGIGFLGAGTILVRKNEKITGLTTAAGLWATATIGLAIGSGFYALAIIGGLFLAGVMIFLTNLKRRDDYSIRRRSSHVDRDLFSEWLEKLYAFYSTISHRNC